MSAGGSAAGNVTEFLWRLAAGITFLTRALPGPTAHQFYTEQRKENVKDNDVNHDKNNHNSDDIQNNMRLYLFSYLIVFPALAR